MADFEKEAAAVAHTFKQLNWSRKAAADSTEELKRQADEHRDLERGLVESEAAYLKAVEELRRAVRDGPSDWPLRDAP